MKPIRTAPAEARGAFTLVELLMVIVIIGILVGLGTAAFIAARGRAINARMSAEIDQLGQGLEKYRQDRGEYPPNPFTADGSKAQNQPYGETRAQRCQRIEQHLRKAFPRYLGNYLPLPQQSQFRDDITRATIDSKFPNGRNIDHLDSAEVLVFFLGGLPNSDTETPLTGFAADPQYPFQSLQQASARTPILFNFNTGRLTDYDNDGWPEYVPEVEVPSGRTPPYVYFDSRSYAKGAHYPVFAQDPSLFPVSAGATLQQLGQDWGYATPYLTDRFNPANPNTRPYVEPKKYQIICAGRDGRYSDSYYDPHNVQLLRVYPTTKNFALGDNDNLASFTTSTLDSQKP